MRNKVENHLHRTTGWIPAFAGMTKKQPVRNVILRLDRGIRNVFNINAKDTSFFIFVTPVVKVLFTAMPVFPVPDPCE